MVQTIPEAQDPGAAYGAFNFHVAIEVKAAPGAKGPQLCKGAFSEVSGLEASMEAKAIKSGGRNYGAYQRAGAVSFSTVVLKRGMTDARDLWTWWSLFGEAGKYGKPSRCNVYVTHLDEARKPALVWKLENAMPVKFKAGDLSAKGGDVAIEELHLVHEGLHIEPPEAAR
jgi:phage tail-like protein